MKKKQWNWQLQSCTLLALLNLIFGCAQLPTPKLENQLSPKEKHSITRFYSQFDLKAWQPIHEIDSKSNGCWEIKWEADTIKQVARKIAPSSPTYLYFKRVRDAVQFHTTNPARNFWDQFLFADSLSIPLLRKVCFRETVIEWIVFDKEFFPVQRLIFYRNHFPKRDYELGFAATVLNDTLKKTAVSKRAKGNSYRKYDLLDANFVVSVFLDQFGTLDFPSHSQDYFYKENSSSWPFWLSDQCAVHPVK